jgi:hypothetical protein
MHMYRPNNGDRSILLCEMARFIEIHHDDKPTNVKKSDEKSRMKISID